jgi:hypothetical protein
MHFFYDSRSKVELGELDLVGDRAIYFAFSLVLLPFSSRIGILF